MRKLAPLRRFVLAAAFLLLLFPPVREIGSSFGLTTTRFRFLFAEGLSEPNLPTLAWAGFLLTLLWFAADPERG